MSTQSTSCALLPSGRVSLSRSACLRRTRRPAASVVYWVRRASLRSRANSPSAAWGEGAQRPSRDQPGGDVGHLQGPLIDPAAVLLDVGLQLLVVAHGKRAGFREGPKASGA